MILSSCYVSCALRFVSTRTFSCNKDTECMLNMQDALAKRFSSMPGKQQFTEAAQLLERAYISLLKGQRTSVDYLEGVAQVRLVFCMVGDLLGQPGYHIHPKLLKIAATLCNDTQLNSSPIAGPAVFLVKYIVRKHGLSILRKVEKDHPWVVPDKLRQEVSILVFTCILHMYVFNFI